MLQVKEQNDCHYGWKFEKSLILVVVINHYVHSGWKDIKGRSWVAWTLLQRKKVIVTMVGKMRKKSHFSWGDFTEVENHKMSQLSSVFLIIKTKDDFHYGWMFLKRSHFSSIDFIMHHYIHSSEKIQMSSFLKKSMKYSFLLEASLSVLLGWLHKKEPWLFWKNSR